MKTGLAISGGGSKGAFAVGAVEVLREYGYKFNMVAGTSTGALIAPLIAINDIETMVSLYTSMTKKDIVRLNWRRLFWDGFYDTKPLEDNIRNTISQEDRYNKLMNSPCDVLLCTVSLQTQEKTFFSQRCCIEGAKLWQDQEEFIKAVLGSTNQPVTMPAIEIDGQQYVDGGVQEVVPLEVLIKAGMERIFVIINSEEPIQREDSRLYTNWYSVGIESLGAMSYEISRNDVRHFVKYNDLLQQVHNAYNAALDNWAESKVNKVFSGIENLPKPIEIVVIRPKRSLGFDGLDFDPQKMQEAREIGQMTAREILDKLYNG